MLEQRFDYTVANFDDVEHIDVKEFNAADLAVLTGFHPGGIYHSKSLRWKCTLDPKNPAEIIRSHKERQSLEHNKEYFLKQGYTFDVKKMTEADYYQFETLYQNTTQKKERSIQYSLKDKILGRILVDAQVYCSGMYSGETLISGLTFSINNDEVLVSFGAKQKFSEVRGGVGGVLEWELIQFCAKNNIKLIDHGKGVNPTGLTSKAGLFEFKARYGNSAFPEGEWVTTFIRNPKIVLSDLVFVNIVNNTVGYTIVTEDENPLVYKKYLTRLVTNTQVLSLSEVVKKARSAF